MTEPSAVHQAVREHYGKLAAQADSPTPGASGCCGEGAEAAGNARLLYDGSLLETLPMAASDLSLGCGDPVTIAGLAPGERVLDLGSGAGLDCFLAAQQVGAAGYVIGVDMTDAMLARANASKARLGLGNVEFRFGQIEALPVEDNSIDVVMSNCVINLSPDKASVFSEVFRVLAPGGRVSISDIVTEGEFSASERADLSQWSACVSGAVEASAYRELMAAAGFTNIKVVDKVAADDYLSCCGGSSPRVYSARITANKPA